MFNLQLIPEAVDKYTGADGVSDVCSRMNRGN